MRLLPACWLLAGLAPISCESGKPVGAVIEPAREAGASPAPEQKDQTREPALRLELSPRRSRWLLGEPATLLVSIVNTGSAPTGVRDLVAPQFGFLVVEVSDADESRWIPWKPAERKEGRGKPEIRVEPEGRVSALVPLYFNSEGWFLREPGVRKVRASFDVGAGPLRSPPVEVEIAKPESEDEQGAASLFMEPSAARFFYLDGGDASGERRMRELIERYPETRHAAYAHFALGKYLAREAYDPATKALRPPDWKAAHAELSAAAEALEDPLFHEAAQVELIQCLDGSGDHAAASSLAHRLESGASGLLTIPRIAELLRPLRGGK